VRRELQFFCSATTKALGANFKTSTKYWRLMSQSSKLTQRVSFHIRAARCQLTEPQLCMRPNFSLPRFNALIRTSKPTTRAFSSTAASFRAQLLRAEPVMATSTTKTGQPLDRPTLDSLLKRRLFYTPSFEIYGGEKGLYDYGPPGCALQANVVNL
jgi:hypothetical protein